MSWLRRRDFLRASLAASVGSAAFGSVFGKLALAQGALPRLKGADYRALVCVFLNGGNDSANTLVPIDGPRRSEYEAARRGSGLGAGGGQENPSDLRLASSSLLRLAPAISQDGSEYGLHPQMSGLRDLYNNGRAAIIANVGPLVQPLDRSDFESDGFPLPAQLFSHSDQTVLWQTPRADSTQRIGWGGRLADLFFASNGNPRLSMNMSIAGENVFQAGQTVLPYFLNEAGAERIGLIDTSSGRSWNQRRRDTFNAIMAAGHEHPFERAYASKVRDAVEVTEQLSATLVADRMIEDGDEVGYLDDVYAPFWQLQGLSWQRRDAGRAALPSLAAQLLMVARVIRQRSSLDMARQLFYVAQHGFDTHDGQNLDQPGLLREFSQAVAAFDQVINAAPFQLGEQVTLFSASEFGRTLSNNGNGTDHGWGGHHIVVGGAVAGGRVYGALPPLALENNPLNAGWGQIIPTLAVDQYAATLARWFGLPDNDRETLFPNLALMTGPKLAIVGPDLGFMRTA